MNNRRADLTLYGVAALAATLPFSGMVQSWVLILAVGLWMAQGNWRLKLSLLRINRWVVFPVALYALVLLGFFNSSDQDEAVFKITQKMAMPLVAVMLASSPLPWITVHRLTMPVFVGAAVLSCAANEAVALYRFVSTPDAGWFFYATYSQFLHPTYFAFVLAIALAWTLRRLAVSSSPDGANAQHVSVRVRFSDDRMLLLFVAAFLVVNILQSASRAGILSLAFVLFLCGPALWRRYANDMRLRLSMLLAVAVVIIASGFYANRLRLDALQHAANVTTVAPNDTESSQTRLLIWREAVTLIGEKPVTGHGTGDVNAVLRERYANAGMYFAAEHALNAHNQYLQNWLASGVLSFLLLAGWLVYGLVATRGAGAAAGFAFYVLAGFNFLFESMLERREGLFVFVFFGCLWLAALSVRPYEKSSSPS